MPESSERVRRPHHLHPTAWVVLLATAAAIALTLWLSFRRLSSYGYSLDLAIYDQAAWLVSRGASTAMSVRGLDVWGHHLNPVLWLFAPCYWLGVGTQSLLVTQAVVVGGATWPLYLLGRDLLRSRWAGTVLAAASLLSPAVSWMLRWDFHPEALAITPTLFAWWFAHRHRWWGYTAMIAVLLALREDLALQVSTIGVAIVIGALIARRRGEHRSITRRALIAGMASITAGALWFVLATRVVIPHFNHGATAFYEQSYFGPYGGSPAGVIRWIVAHPGRFARVAASPPRPWFAWRLIAPLGGLPLLSPLAWWIAAPQWLVAALGSHPGLRSIRFHYTAMLTGPLLIGTVDGLARVRRWALRARRPLARRAALAWLGASALATSALWSVTPLGDLDQWSQPGKPRAVLDRALALVPADASVSATFEVLPRLTQRRHAYLWPIPFLPFGNLWGNGGCTGMPDPGTIEYLVIVDRPWPAPNHLLAAMLGSSFEVLSREADVTVARRVTPPNAAELAARADSCRGMDGVER